VAFAEELGASSFKKPERDMMAQWSSIRNVFCALNAVAQDARCVCYAEALAGPLSHTGQEPNLSLLWSQTCSSFTQIKLLSTQATRKSGQTGSLIQATASISGCPRKTAVALILPVANAMNGYTFYTIQAVDFPF
jgi:hypothetical protein